MVDSAVRSSPATRDPSAVALEEIQALARERLASAPATTVALAATPAPAPVGPEPELATRSRRLVARAIDQAILGLVAGPGVLAAVGLFASLFARSELAWHGFARGAAWTVLVVSSVATAVLLLYQWACLALEGQTIGKRQMAVRVVLEDGRPAGFFEAVFLRSWVTACLGVAPYVGQAAITVDALLILGPGRRCLHDRVAGTKVVSTLPPSTALARWRARLLWAVASLALGVGVTAWARPDVARALFDQTRGALAGAGLVDAAPAPTTTPVEAAPVGLTPPVSAPVEAPPAQAGSPAAPAEVEQALAALRDPAPRARWEAAQTLGRTPAAAGRADVAAALLRALQEDEHFMVRADAAAALGHVGAGADTTVAAALGRAAASDPSDAVRSAASAALR